MDRIFAISDIHGCFKTFYELIVNTIKLQKSDQLILLGDYIDRGKQIKEVVDFIIDLRKEGFNTSVLAGNHEVMLIDSYNDIDQLSLWMMNSGFTTLDSFGISDIRDIDPVYMNFFNSLEYYKIIGNVIFVHAGFDDLAADPFSDPRSMIWETHDSYHNRLLSGKTIIHGHRPKTIAYVKKLIAGKSKVIAIDTGCVYQKELGYGMLSALEVNTMTLYSIPHQ
jgi:serine/threonine protein phosphatase 1